MARPRIVIVGAGYVGLSASRRLQAKLRRGEAWVTVVDPRPYLTYQPFLADAAAGSIEPRHVVTPLRELLPKCRVLTGSVTTVDSRRPAAFVAVDGSRVELECDLLVVAPGSVSKVLPVPGLADRAVGFTTLGEAIYLRNHVLTQIDKAAGTPDAGRRRARLTFLFAGAGFAGVEALGQLEEMSRFAISRYHPGLDPSDMRWVLVEAADRIMPEVSLSLADHTQEVLSSRGIEIHMETTVESIEDGHAVLSDGTEFSTETVVWTTGISPHPLVEESDLPRHSGGRVQCQATLEVAGRTGVFAGGDCAAVPDLAAEEPDTLCAPTAQHAIRQGKQLADNLLATIRGEPLTDYHHEFAGSVASLGRHYGVAELFGRTVTGWPAWAMHRAYHWSRMPTLNRRARILADWFLGMAFPREVVALGEVHEPVREFAEQARR